jgi:hypothetical protein
MDLRGATALISFSFAFSAIVSTPFFLVLTNSRLCEIRKRHASPSARDFSRVPDVKFAFLKKFQFDSRKAAISQCFKISQSSYD